MKGRGFWYHDDYLMSDMVQTEELPRDTRPSFGRVLLLSPSSKSTTLTQGAEEQLLQLSCTNKPTLLDYVLFFSRDSTKWTS
nr:unnamed protein product [Haemonchus contortus]